MKRKAPLYLLMYSLLVCFAYTALADDSVYSGDGIDVYPLESADIQLVAEVITVTDKGGEINRFDSGRFDVDVDMIFKNHGAQTTVQMGFPILAEWSEGERTELDPDFRTWVNGEEVKITKKRGIPNPIKKFPHFSDAVYTYAVNFKQNETIKIKHRYAVGGTIDSMGGWNFTYILRTGALWKDAIENIKIIFKANTSKLHEIHCVNPPEQTREQHGEKTNFIWNFADFEPTSNFIISGNITLKPTADKAEALGVCRDYYQSAAEPLQADADNSRNLYDRADDYRVWSIRLFGTEHIFVMKKFRPEIVFPLWLFLMLLCGLLSYRNAVNKNLDRRFWLIVGALTAPLTLLYIYFIPKRK